jgi:hypothetical protein
LPVTRFSLRVAVPLGDGIAVVIGGDELLLPSHQGVAVLDVVEVADDGDGWLRVAARAEVPLKIADPEHEVGYDGGARIDLDAEKLVRVHGEAGVLEYLLRLAE